jgi:hypothetical protein
MHFLKLNATLFLETENDQILMIFQCSNVRFAVLQNLSP